MYGKAQTERRTFERPDNHTQFQINTGSVQSIIIIQGIATVFFTEIIVQIFRIRRETIIADIIDSQSSSQVHSIFDIERYIEIILTDTAGLLAEEIIAITIPTHYSILSGRPVHHTGLGTQDSQHRQLIPIFCIRIVHTDNLILKRFRSGNPYSFHSYVHQFRQLPTLRETVIQYSSHREQTIEILALMIIEPKIHKTQRSIIANLIAIYKTDLVERSACPVFLHRCAIKITLRCRIIETERQCNIIAAIDADTGRVRAHHRHIAAQSAHCTTHTHKTSCSVQIITKQPLGIVCILCTCRCHCQQRTSG